MRRRFSIPLGEYGEETADSDHNPGQPQETAGGIMDNRVSHKTCHHKKNAKKKKCNAVKFLFHPNRLHKMFSLYIIPEPSTRDNRTDFLFWQNPDGSPTSFKALRLWGKSVRLDSTSNKKGTFDIIGLFGRAPHHSCSLHRCAGRPNAWKKIGKAFRQIYIGLSYEKYNIYVFLL